MEVQVHHTVEWRIVKPKFPLCWGCSGQELIPCRNHVLDCSNTAEHICELCVGAAHAHQAGSGKGCARDSSGLHTELDVFRIGKQAVETWYVGLADDQYMLRGCRMYVPECHEILVL